MSFTGKWNITINTPMGNQEGVLELVQDGDNVTGTMSAQGENVSIENGRVEGDNVLWDVNVSKPMPLTLSFKGEKSGDNLGGSVQLGAFGQSTFEAVAV